jgi:hypothetical protein
MDCSESMSDQYFLDEVNADSSFIEAATKNLGAYGTPISPVGIEVAVAEFTIGLEVHMNLTVGHSPKAMDAEISQLKKNSECEGLSSIGSALVDVGSKIFTTTAGHRTGVPKVVLLLTDGQDTEGTKDAVAAADALKKAGVKIITVIMPSWTAKTKPSLKAVALLQKIASSTDFAKTQANFLDIFDSANLPTLSKFACPHLKKLA